ncbi:ribosomal protein S5 domain 2-type protein [Pisolithus albus]|nr:ribosomal protein S5 domain 2-type protein [Pisolithus albus]
MGSLRSVKISFDSLAGVDGSARFSFGDACSALASVSGPIAARPASEHPARGTVEVHVRPLSSVPGTTEKLLGSAFKGIIESACLLGQHPRTLTQVVVQALSQPSSALVAAEINACSLALVNAGSVPLRGVVCSVVVGLRLDGNETQFILDPEDEKLLDGTFCFALLFGITSGSFQGKIPPSEVVWMSSRTYNGVPISLDTHKLKLATELARKGATEVWLRMRESLGGSPSAFDHEEPMEV